MLIPFDTGVTNESGVGIVLLAGGKILVSGQRVGPTNVLYLFNANGALDTTWGAGGKVVSQIGIEGFGATAMTLQADGKIVHTGLLSKVNSDSALMDYALCRQLADGAMDASFGSGGVASRNIAGTYDQFTTSVVLGDGKILALGESYDGAASRKVLARFSADGAFDTSFGSNGIADLPAALGNWWLKDMALQSDGKIVVLGSVYLSPTQWDVGLVRVHGDGTLDVSFGAGGITMTDYANHRSSPTCICIQPDDKVLVGGSVGDGGWASAVFRYSAAGVLDTTFSADGVAIYGVGGDSSSVERLGLQSDGRIIAAGRVESYYWSVWSDFTVMRFLNDGTLDTSFGSGGLRTFSIATSDYLTDFLIQPDNRIVLAGPSHSYNSPTSLALVSLTPDGGLDADFGTGGMVVLPNSAGFEADVLRQSDGRLIVGTVSGSTLSLMRLNCDGSADNTFGGTGSVTHPWVFSRGQGDFLRAAPASGILITGGIDNDYDADFFLARIQCGPMALPELAVEHPAGTGHANGQGVLTFGTTATGAASLPESVLVRNLGAGALSSITCSLTGSQAGEFILDTANVPAGVDPNRTGAIAVRYSPTAAGSATAVLRIVSNDPDESPFEITLVGTCDGGPADCYQAWAAAAGLTGGNAQPSATPHGDGVSNLLKYAFNMNPTAMDCGVLQENGGSGLPGLRYFSSPGFIIPWPYSWPETGSWAGSINGGGIIFGPWYESTFSYIRRPASGLAYEVKSSATLLPGSWSTVTAIPVVERIDSEWERVTITEGYFAPPSSRFFKVEISMP